MERFYSIFLLRRIDSVVGLIHLTSIDFFGQEITLSNSEFLILLILYVSMDIFLTFGLIKAKRFRRKIKVELNIRSPFDQIFHFIFKLFKKRRIFPSKILKNLENCRNDEFMLVTIKNKIEEKKKEWFIIYCVSIFMIGLISLDGFRISGILYIYYIILYAFEYSHYKELTKWIFLSLDIIRWQDQIIGQPSIENDFNAALLDEDFANQSTMPNGDLN